jgi:hypothetical protein
MSSAARRVCEPWETVTIISEPQSGDRIYELCLAIDGVNRCSAALDKFSCVTQRSQSLALGLTITAAPQLVEL